MREKKKKREQLKKPETRGECANIPRPCPFVSCRYNLYFDVTKTGHLLKNFDCEPFEMKESCALDIADRGQTQLHKIAEALGVSRQAIEQALLRYLERYETKLKKLYKGDVEGKIDFIRIM